MGAFEERYADDVEMAEIGQDPRVGKDANRVYEQQFVDGIEAFHGAEVRGVAVDETGDGTGTAFVE